MQKRLGQLWMIRSYIGRAFIAIGYLLLFVGGQGLLFSSDPAGNPTCEAGGEEGFPPANQDGAKGGCAPQDTGKKDVRGKTIWSCGGDCGKGGTSGITNGGCTGNKSKTTYCVELQKTDKKTHTISYTCPSPPASSSGVDCGCQSDTGESGDPNPTYTSCADYPVKK